MTDLDRRLTSEEQILMRREIEQIRLQMLQICEAVEFNAGRLAPPHIMMFKAQMMAMGQQVQMIRQRCVHVWDDEYIINSGDTSVSHMDRVCAVCQLREEVHYEPESGIPAKN